jgi:hydroxypyruvate isomerase
LRYASHLGYRSVDTPLFRESVGTLDPVAHVDFAADLGLAGIQYALAVTRPATELDAVARALARRGLQAGCVLYTDPPKLAHLLWGSADASAQEACRRELDRSFEVARRLNARHIAILSGMDSTRPRELQQAMLVDNLRRVAEAAEREGFILCLETLSRRSLPGMLLAHIAQAYAIVKAVASPAVRLIFDTSHVQIMDGDVLENLRATWDAVAVLQIADNPGRFEPGSGELNFDNILRAVHELAYRGLVELEHGWSAPGRQAEEQGIENLRRIDSRLHPII